MKKTTLLLFLVSLYSCGQKESYQETFPTEEVQYLGSQSTDNSVGGKKYFYTVLSVYKPTIELSKGQYTFKPEFSLSTSPVSDTDSWDEDTEYKILDLYENALNQELNLADKSFESEAKLHGIKTEVKKSRVVTRKFYIFDTYKEASISRKEIVDNPEKYNPEK